MKVELKSVDKQCDHTLVLRKGQFIGEVELVVVRLDGKPVSITVNRDELLSAVTIFAGGRV